MDGDFPENQLGASLKVENKITVSYQNAPDFPENQLGASLKVVSPGLAAD